MNLKLAITQIFKVSLLLVFIGYYSSITLFYHIHIVNGVAVVHSHLYKSNSDSKVPVKKHSHLGYTFDIIQKLSNVYSNGAILNKIQLIVLTQVYVQLFKYNSLNSGLKIYSELPSRAPPRAVS